MQRNPESDLRLSDLKVKREPKADQHTHLTQNEPGLVFFDYQNYELFRNVLGWHAIDEPACDTCSLSDYGRPEYKVCGGCNICLECGCRCDDVEFPQEIKGDN
jgi:hypothetical protein